MLTDWKAEINKCNNSSGLHYPTFLIRSRSFRQKIINEILYLNYTLYQVDLTDIYRTFHPATAEYTFFSSTQWYIFAGEIIC